MPSHFRATAVMLRPRRLDVAILNPVETSEVPVSVRPVSTVSSGSLCGSYLAAGPGPFPFLLFNIETIETTETEPTDMRFTCVSVWSRSSRSALLGIPVRRPITPSPILPPATRAQAQTAARLKPIQKASEALSVT